jgi:hypothetical protein
LLTSLTKVQCYVVVKIENYWLKSTVKIGRAIADPAYWLILSGVEPPQPALIITFSALFF